MSGADLLREGLGIARMEAQQTARGRNGRSSISMLMAVAMTDRIEEIEGASANFLTAYEAASVSDEEGLLAAVDPDEMRQLWHRVDEAATKLRQALARAADSQAGAEE